MKGFEVIAHQRTIRVYSAEMKKWLTLGFDADAWDRLIQELNNPPDLGVEVHEVIRAKEEISGG